MLPPPPRQEHLDLLFRWVRYASKFNLSDVLRSRNIEKIAIYGGGALGVALYENLHTNITIKCIIDKNPTLSFHHNIKTILPTETEYLKELDLVIITVDFNNVKQKLEPYVKCLSLDDLIIDIDSYLLFKEVVQYVEERRATLLLADLTAALYHIKNPSLFEKVAKTGLWMWRNLIGGDVLKDYYIDLNYSLEDVEYLYSTEYWNIIERNGDPVFNDVSSKLVNVINGYRLTTDVPDKYCNTIYFCGDCVAFGWAAEDKYTIESYLQRMLNKSKVSDDVFRVVNYSIPHIRKEISSFLHILNIPLQSGDYVVLISQDLLKFEFYRKKDSVVKFIDLKCAFDRPHEYSGEIFFDDYHMNHRGYKLLANKFYDVFSNLFAQRSSSNNSHKQVISGHIPLPQGAVQSTDDSINSENGGLDKYLNILRNEKVDVDGVIGSIVMNCNPFTLGHRYLIEEATKNCDFLYIFIIEENKSYFSFDDRFECVQKGTSDIENIKILPSGNFIISTLTFPEYFIKESSKATIDASLDIKIFSEKIAPVLGINKRFAGSEPFCEITHQYNQMMSEILPQYGIEFLIFERIKIDSVPISASKVRELLNNHKYQELKAFVPESTYKYLLDFKNV